MIPEFCRFNMNYKTVYRQFFKHSLFKKFGWTWTWCSYFFTTCFGWDGKNAITFQVMWKITNFFRANIVQGELVPNLPYLLLYAKATLRILSDAEYTRGRGGSDFFYSKSNERGFYRMGGGDESEIFKVMVIIISKQNIWKKNINFEMNL